MMDGEPLQLYITETHWSEITPLTSTSYDMGWNSRAYLSTTQDWSKDTYFKPDLLGGTMEYDVDLSRVDCGCVAALYVIGMPGIGSDGQPFESSDGLHYCDAQAVGGNFCPEFDIMEANQWAYHATSHSCDTPDANGHYTNCDRPGTCDLDIFDNQPDINFGPGAQYQINTLQEFHTKVEFKQDDDGEFSEYSIILSQEGREVVMTTSNCSDGLSRMTEDFRNGMTFAMSVWAPNYGDLEWMQHDRCDSPCSE